MIPDEWKVAKDISIFKKGDRTVILNYKVVKYKTYGKIINEIFHSVSDIEEQAGFQSGHFCIDDILFSKTLIEKRQEFHLEAHVTYTDYENAFD